jgi:hypothetical protein
MPVLTSQRKQTGEIFIKFTRKDVVDEEGEAMEAAQVT